MFDYSVTGKAAPALGICTSLHIINVRLFILEDGQAPAPTDNNKEVAA